MLMLMIANHAVAVEPSVLRVSLPISSFASKSQSDASIAVGVFLKRCFEGSDLRYESRVYETDTDLIEAIQNGRSDVFIMNASLYLDSAEKAAIRPLLVTANTGDKALETLVLVCAKDRLLSDLKDGTLIIDNSARGRTPERWISDSLIRYGSDELAEDYFLSINFVKAASRAVIPVYFGKADAAIISATDFEKMCEHNPDITKRLYIASKSKPLARSIVCMRADYDDYRPNQIVEVLGQLHQSEDGRSFLERIATTKLLPFKKDYLLYNWEIQNRLKNAAAQREEQR
ncbi:MAG: ABC-type phosphate/phosphonate transport system substrate-binding protein [Verrucomicrobiales bacterium]|jgi:ABC-type phosphate/phosphonate transport system substrate-binding protein